MAYFPFSINNYDITTLGLLEILQPNFELWKLQREMNLLEVGEETLYRPFSTLSGGEQTKILLALLFAGIDYRAIAKIKVKNIYRGDLKPGETVSVLLPSPIDANIWVKDTEVISSMKIAMTGIFMPMKYDDTSYSEENGARLHLKDIAEYGLLDGMRYTF